MTAEQYITERVEDQISWYEKKSAINKKYHLWTNASIIIFAALIPFLAGISEEELEWTKYLIAVLGVLTATLTGISALYKFQEKWATYRITGESLKREKLLFQTKTQPYNSGSNSFNQFVSNVESLMSSENAGWTQIINKKDEQSANGDALMS